MQTQKDGSLLSVVSHLLTQKRHESQRNIGCCSCISPNILSKNGLSQRSIARQLNVAQSSVSKTLKGIQDEGSYRSRERSGRPQKTSRTSDRLLHRIAVSNPSVTSSENSDHSRESPNIHGNQGNWRVRAWWRTSPLSKDCEELATRLPIWCSCSMAPTVTWSEPNRKLLG